jgi:hypothetical protein
MNNIKKLILLSLVLFGCEEKQPKIGKLYKHSYSYLGEPENPFEVINMDTVKVLDVKQGYVLYQFNDGVQLSSTIYWFNKITQEIK